MDFSIALDELKDGRWIAREGWNGLGMHLNILDPDPQIDIVTQPYIAITAVDGSIVPWTASQTDLLATDWMVIDG